MDTEQSSLSGAMAPVHPEQGERLRALAVKLGSLQAVARVLKVSELTASKAASGLPLSRGSRAWITQRLAELDAAAGRAP